MATRKSSPARDFWRPRVEGQLRDAMQAHPEWFNAATPGKAAAIVASLAKRIIGEIAVVELHPAAATAPGGGSSCTEPGMSVVVQDCEAPAGECIARAPQPDADPGPEATDPHDAPARAIEVRRRGDGTLDEIVAAGCVFHLEKMSDDRWWMAISKDGYRQVVNFGVEQGRLRAMTECDDWPQDPDSAPRTIEGFAFLAYAKIIPRLGLKLRADIVPATCSTTTMSCLERARRLYRLEEAVVEDRGRVIPVLIVPRR